MNHSVGGSAVLPADVLFPGRPGGSRQQLSLPRSRRRSEAPQHPLQAPRRPAGVVPRRLLRAELLPFPSGCGKLFDYTRVATFPGGELRVKLEKEQGAATTKESTGPSQHARLTPLDVDLDDVWVQFALVAEVVQRERLYKTWLDRRLKATLLLPRGRLDEGGDEARLLLPEDRHSGAIRGGGLDHLHAIGHSVPIEVPSKRECSAAARLERVNASGAPDDSRGRYRVEAEAGTHVEHGHPGTQRFRKPSIDPRLPPGPQWFGGGEFGGQQERIAVDHALHAAAHLDPHSHRDFRTRGPPCASGARFDHDARLMTFGGPGRSRIGRVKRGFVC